MRGLFAFLHVLLATAPAARRGAIASVPYYDTYHGDLVPGGWRRLEAGAERGAAPKGSNRCDVLVGWFLHGERKKWPNGWMRGPWAVRLGH